MNNGSLLNDARIGKAILALLVLGALFLAVKVLAEVKSYRYIGGGVPAANTISVAGEGEVFAVPDIATISFSVRLEGKTVTDAQKKVTERINAALSFLRGAGIEEKDIKTAAYNAYPQYDYNVKMIYPTPPGNRVLVGYEVSQTINIKVRDTEKAGAVLDGLAKAGITDLSGPNFEIDDDTILHAEARKKAIADARTRAEALTKDLGVRIVRVVNFSESGNYPIYFKAMDARLESSGGSASAPQLPAGENRIVSNVTITYEIR